MPVGLVGDIHLGVRCEKSAIKEAVVAGQRETVRRMAEDFRSRGITDVFFSGDVFTVHHFMTIDVMAFAIEMFRDIFAGMTCHVIAGNHDYLYENKDSITSLQLLELIPNVKVYRSGVQTLDVAGNTWYMVPWIFPDKLEAVNEWLGKLARKAKAARAKTVLFGHFDMVGALMEAGQISDIGLPMEKYYKAANHVFSGHYHCKSYNKGKDPDASILYMGTPYHLSFAHVNTDCGYYIVNDDLGLEFVENTWSPRFVDADDEHLEGLGDLSNRFVRYFCRNDRPYDDASARKAKLMEAKPLFVKTVYYGGEAETIEEARRVDDEEARKLLSADTITMAEMYMDKYPETLPSFWSKEDPKRKILGILATYGTKVQ